MQTCAATLTDSSTEVSPSYRPTRTHRATSSFATSPLPRTDRRTSKTVHQEQILALANLALKIS